MPVALQTALATAAALPTMPIPPMPLVPIGLTCGSARPAAEAPASGWCPCSPDELAGRTRANPANPQGQGDVGSFYDLLTGKSSLRGFLFCRMPIKLEKRSPAT